MGMNTRGAGGSNKTYLGVYSNQLVLEYTKEEDLVKKLEALGYDPDKIQERKKMKGKNEGQSVFYFVVYDVEGMIADIRIKENDWGDFVELELDDVGDKFVISLGDIFGRAAKDFIRRIGNLDLSEFVNFGLWSLTNDDGKQRSGVKMYQDEEKVDYFLTYDDMPEPTQKKKGRKVEWDYSEQETYIYDYLVEYLDENFKSTEVKEEAPKKETPKGKKEPAANAKAPRKARGKAVAATEGKGLGAEKDDDMPF